MGWGKLDDNLHDHHKVDELNDVAPLGLWTLCLTWAHRHRKSRPDPSFVPWGTVDRLGRRKARTYAKELLRVHLWENADGGIRIHDFGDYLPGGTDEERTEKARNAARARWGDAKGNANEHAPEHPSGMPDDMQTDASRAAAPRSDSDSLGTSNEVPASSAKPPRTDVERICKHLVEVMVDNDFRKPPVTAKWRTDARLLIDKDRRSLDEILQVIDWAWQDKFWKGNIRSVPKLREKYDQLRLKSGIANTRQIGSSKHAWATR